MLKGVRRVDLSKVEGGVERSYTFPEGYGPNDGIAFLTVRFRAAAIANAGFQAALTELVLRRPDVATKRNSLRAMMDDPDFMGVIWDHIILDVKTNLQVEGGTLDVDRDGFIALMRYTGDWSEAANDAGFFAPEVAAITMTMLGDIFDFANFYMDRKEALQGN